MLQSNFSKSLLALSVAASLGLTASAGYAQGDMQRILEAGKSSAPAKAAEMPRPPAVTITPTPQSVVVAPAPASSGVRTAGTSGSPVPVVQPSITVAPAPVVVQAPGSRSAVGSRVEVQDEKKPPVAKSENLFPKVTGNTDLEALGRLGEDVMLKKLKQELQGAQGGNPAGQGGMGAANANAASTAKPADEEPVLLAVYGVDEDLRGDIQFRGARISVKQGDSIGNGWRVSSFGRGRLVLSHSKQKPREILFGSASKQPPVAAQTGVGGNGFMPPPMPMMAPPQVRS